MLLDVSASLYALVLEGNLLFDDTAEEELHLQVCIVCLACSATQLGKLKQKPQCTHKYHDGSCLLLVTSS